MAYGAEISGERYPYGPLEAHIAVGVPTEVRLLEARCDQVTAGLLDSALCYGLRVGEVPWINCHKRSPRIS